MESPPCPSTAVKLQAWVGSQDAFPTHLHHALPSYLLPVQIMLGAQSLFFKIGIAQTVQGTTADFVHVVFVCQIRAMTVNSLLAITIHTIITKL